MPETDFKQWNETVDYYKKYPWLGSLVIFLLGLGTGLILGLSSNLDNWFLDGFWPEALGIVITVGLIERITHNIEEHSVRKQFEANLVRSARSVSNDKARDAISILRDEDLILGERSLLKEANLTFADLRGADLVDANLEKANLLGADLSGAYIEGANIDNVKWGWVEARVIKTHTQEPGTMIAYPTILPDGIPWKPGTDLVRFVDALHPEYHLTLAKINNIRKSLGLPINISMFVPDRN